MQLSGASAGQDMKMCSENVLHLRVILTDLWNYCTLDEIAGNLEGIIKFLLHFPPELDNMNSNSKAQ